MNAADFVQSIHGFARLSYSEQIKRFSWFLTCKQAKPIFTGADVSKCYDQTDLPKPSSVSPFLGSLAKQKPPFLLKKKSGYQLSRHAREQFDDALGNRAATVAVDKLLTELPSRLSADYERVYLNEALLCFRVSAYRAAVVMAWNLAYDHLCGLIMSTHLVPFNSQLPKSFPKADITTISHRDDLMLLKESQVLQVAKSATIISPNVHKIMKEKLDRRNIAAHPSGVEISQLTAEDFIRDLVINVVLKL